MSDINKQIKLKIKQLNKEMKDIIDERRELLREYRALKIERYDLQDDLKELNAKQ